MDLGESIEQYYKPLVLALQRLPLPVIAAVNGVAAGAGANIALACDLVIAARSASFVQAFSRLGLVPDSGGTWSLPRLVGNARALGLTLLGEKLSAAQACGLGTDLALRRRCGSAGRGRRAGEAIGGRADTRAGRAPRPPLRAAVAAHRSPSSWTSSATLQRELGRSHDYAGGRRRVPREAHRRASWAAEWTALPPHCPTIPSGRRPPVRWPRALRAAISPRRRSGIELLEAAPERARVAMTVRADMLNGHATCHGGMIFALADTAFAFACNSARRCDGGRGRQHRIPGAGRRGRTADRDRRRDIAHRASRHLRRRGRNRSPANRARISAAVARGFDYHPQNVERRIQTMIEAFICDAIRTPIGRYGGALSGVRPDDLAAVVLRELLRRNPGLDPKAVDDVILGCANQAGEDNRNVARMSALLAGLPVDVPGATLNRLCGSGLDALAGASRMMRSGEADLVIAGGVESMSRAPYVMSKSSSRIRARRTDVRHHHRLALRQPAPPARLWHRLDAGDRRERRGAISTSRARTRIGSPCAANSAPWRRKRPACSRPRSWAFRSRPSAVSRRW